MSWVTDVISLKINKSTRMDEVSASVNYIGLADIGTLDNEPLWQIQRVSVSGTVTSVDWADGDNKFDNVWDDRASLNYS